MVEKIFILGLMIIKNSETFEIVPGSIRKFFFSRIGDFKLTNLNLQTRPHTIISIRLF